MPTRASSTTHRPEGSDLKLTKEGPQRALRMITLPPTLIESEPSEEVEVELGEETRQTAPGPSSARVSRR